MGAFVCGLDSVGLLVLCSSALIFHFMKGAARTAAEDKQTNINEIS